jgi:hypothetical protein
VAQVREGVEEVLDRLARALATARLAVVDEVDAEQALAGAGVAFVYRFPVEATDQLLVLLQTHREQNMAGGRRSRYGPGMGCLVVLFAFISPRLALFVLFLFTDVLSRAYDSWILPFLGFFLLPWTTLAYAAMWEVGSDKVSGFEWFVVVLAFAVDLGSYMRGERERSSRS